MNRLAKYATAVVVAHLLVNVAHGLAHRELQVGLVASDAIFVIVVILTLPLLAMGLVWTVWKRLGLVLLSLSMFGSFLFGLYHHFLAMGPDNVHAQSPNSWGLTFILTAYGLLITEALGTYVGVHFLWTGKPASNKIANSRTL